MKRVEHLAEGVTLYLGDCREILPTLPKVDAVVTDPPYGLTRWFEGAGWTMSADECAMASKWNSGSVKDILASLVGEGCPPTIIWGFNYLADVLGSCRGPLIWDKEKRRTHFAEAEIAWCSFGSVSRVFEGQPTFDKREHPTQKPIEVMEWCLDKLPSGCRTVLDPFMGSGTTGVAAVKLGRQFIGVEIEPKYYDIACKRISDALKQPDMFVEPPKLLKQTTMW